MRDSEVYIDMNNTLADTMKNTLSNTMSNTVYSIEGCMATHLATKVLATLQMHLLQTTTSQPLMLEIAK